MRRAAFDGQYNAKEVRHCVPVCSVAMIQKPSRYATSSRLPCAWRQREKRVGPASVRSMLQL